MSPLSSSHHAPEMGALGALTQAGYPRTLAGQHSPVPPADLVTSLSHGVSPGVSLWQRSLTRKVPDHSQ